MAPHAAPRDTTYSFQIIAYPGALRTDAASINNDRDIVGEYEYDVRGPWHAFLFHEGNYFNIDVPGAFLSAANGINNSGKIVGAYTTVDPHTCTFDCGTHAFLREDEEHYISIEPPGATGSDPFAINDRGQVVGDYAAPGHGLQHFLFDKGEFTTISGPDANLFGLNNRGDLLFTNSIVNRRGEVTVLAFPGAVYTAGFSINNSGQVAGFYQFPNTAGGVVFRGYVYDRGSYQTVLYPGAQETFLFGINNRGDVVGSKDGFTAFVGLRE
jgi:hypothetical protein